MPLVAVYTEGGEALRTVRIPSALISRFVALADPNTQRNIETLGLLMGRLTRDVFTVSHLMGEAWRRASHGSRLTVTPCSAKADGHKRSLRHSRRREQ